VEWGEGRRDDDGDDMVIVVRYGDTTLCVSCVK
jgi:hypothetical protein